MSSGSAVATPKPEDAVTQGEGVRDDGQRPGRLAVIVNPARIDGLDEVKAEVAGVVSEAGWGEPLWIDTTPEDPGEGQAREAVAAGATVVCSLGGDGTTRSVASGLVDTGVPLGLLPGGTGNLLARNLGVPLDDLPAALRVALAGVTAAVDVGAVTWDDDPEQVFLVMAGMGMDGRMMGDADERIKAVVGWPAYLLSGVRALFDRGFSVRVSTGDQHDFSRRARMVVVGNCGQLTAGLELMPDARVDDGELDAVLVAPRGLAGWAAVVRDVLAARRGDRRHLRRFAAERVEVTTGRPILAELDGDAVGPRRRMVTRALPGALLVCVPGEGEAVAR